MEKMMCSLTAFALAFGLGLACGGSVSPATNGRDAMPLTLGAVPQLDLNREDALREELSRLRAALERYATEHAKGLRPKTYPQSLGDLVAEGYLTELPIDPVTGRRDWQAEEPVCLSSGGRHSWGVFDVHSSSSAVSSEGTRYNEW